MQVILGIKFFLNEQEIKQEGVVLKICFSNQKKSRLLDFIIDNGISCSSLGFSDIRNFKFDPFPISITVEDSLYTISDRKN